MFYVISDVWQHHHNNEDWQRAPAVELLRQQEAVYMHMHSPQRHHPVSLSAPAISHLAVELDARQW